MGADTEPTSKKQASSQPLLRDDACWRAFDLLGQGNGAVTGVTLGQLFAPSEVRDWIAAGGGIGGSPMPGVGRPRDKVPAPHVAKLDHMVRTTYSTGMVTSSGFLDLLQGRLPSEPHKVPSLSSDKSPKSSRSTMTSPRPPERQEKPPQRQERPHVPEVRTGMSVRFPSVDELYAL